MVDPSSFLPSLPANPRKLCTECLNMLTFPPSSSSVLLLLLICLFLFLFIFFYSFHSVVPYFIPRSFHVAKVHELHSFHITSPLCMCLLLHILHCSPLTSPSFLTFFTFIYPPVAFFPPSFSAAAFLLQATCIAGPRLSVVIRKHE